MDRIAEESILAHTDRACLYCHLVKNLFTVFYSTCYAYPPSFNSLLKMWSFLSKRKVLFFECFKTTVLSINEITGNVQNDPILLFIQLVDWNLKFLPSDHPDIRKIFSLLSNHSNSGLVVSDDASALCNVSRIYCFLLLLYKHSDKCNEHMANLLSRKITTLLDISKSGSKAKLIHMRNLTDFIKIEYESHRKGFNLMEDFVAMCSELCEKFILEEEKNREKSLISKKSSYWKSLEEKRQWEESQDLAEKMILKGFEFIAEIAAFLDSSLLSLILKGDWKTVLNAKRVVKDEIRLAGLRLLDFILDKMDEPVQRKDEPDEFDDIFDDIDYNSIEIEAIGTSETHLNGSNLLDEFFYPHLWNLLICRWSLQGAKTILCDRSWLFASAVFCKLCKSLVAKGIKSWKLIYSSLGYQSFWITKSVNSEKRQFPIRLLYDGLSVDFSSVFRECTLDCYSLWFLSHFEVDCWLSCDLDALLCKNIQNVSKGKDKFNFRIL